jgi:OPA family glycerol-3-phosphate transporter-like MFS transporter
MGDSHLRRWQSVTLRTLFVGYAGYYVCRSNLSVVTPLLLTEFAGEGVTKESIGIVASLGVFLYSLGKVSNGVLADYLGGRAIFLTGMAASVVCTLLFGLSGGLAAFMVTWAANRYVQSMGWGALVKIAARWFPSAWHATAMAALSLSYLVGDAAARVYLGTLIQLGLGWRGVFFVSAATLAAVAVCCALTLRDSPQAVGAPEPAPGPRDLFARTDDAAARLGVWALLAPFFGSFTFWLACVLNVGVTLLRETFLFWTPTYLVEVVGFRAAAAASLSLFFPLLGAASVPLAGVLSDRWRGRHGRVLVPCLALLVAVLALLAEADCTGRPALALLLIGGVAFFLLAPYSFPAGVMALELGGKRGGATAAGLIDGAGYFGAILSGFGVGRVADIHGWPMAFRLLAGVAGLTLLAAALYWAYEAFRPARETPPPEIPS